MCVDGNVQTTAATIEIMEKFYSLYVQTQLIESLERKSAIFVNVSSTYSSVNSNPFSAWPCM